MAEKKKKVVKKNRTVYLFFNEIRGFKETLEEAGYDVEYHSLRDVDFQTVVLSASPDAAVIHSNDLVKCEFDAEKIKTCSTTTIFLLVRDQLECRKYLREKSRYLGKRILWINVPYSLEYIPMAIDDRCPALPDPKPVKKEVNLPKKPVYDENFTYVTDEMLENDEELRKKEENKHRKFFCLEKVENFLRASDIRDDRELFGEAIFLAAYDISDKKTYSGTVLKGVSEKFGITPEEAQSRIKKVIKNAIKNPFNSFFVRYVEKLGDNSTDRKIVMEIGNDIISKYEKK